VKQATPLTRFSLWRSEQLFNIDFASYSLSHHSFARHFHDHYVIEIVTTGLDSFYCDGKNYRAETGQLVLINPGEVHTGSTVSGVPLHYFSLYPDGKALQQVAASLNITLPNDLFFQRSLLDEPALTKKFRLLFEALHANAESLKLEEIFFDCMSGLLQPGNFDHTGPVPVNDSRIKLLTEYIRSHFDENISLQQLADLVRLDPCHLVRLFRKSIGLSPYDYLLIMRAEKARQLLRNGQKVKDAALACGFCDSSHFNRVFHKIAVTSPRSFRSSKSQYCTSFPG
jgi:AraC-like DNA-binding protein